jgi:hypothetical protein
VRLSGFKQGTRRAKPKNKSSRQMKIKIESAECGFFRVLIASKSQWKSWECVGWYPSRSAAEAAAKQLAA